MVVLLCISSPSIAQRWISASSGAHGTVIVTLSWVADYCDGLYLPVAPTAVIVGTSITVTSTNYFFDCNPPMPPYPPLGVASQPLDLGVLPDGSYTVQWVFPNISTANPAVPPPVYGFFTVRSGVALSGVPVPVADRSALTLLMSAMVAFVFLRSRSQRARWRMTDRRASWPPCARNEWCARAKAEWHRACR
jgi:hypothetical protein